MHTEFMQYDVLSWFQKFCMASCFFLHTTFPATSIKYFAKCTSLIQKTCFITISVYLCSLW